MSRPHGRLVLSCAVAATSCAAATILGSSARAAPPDAGDDVTPCRAAQIAISAAPTQGAVGHRGVTLVFTLAGGAAPCTLTGYPGVDSGAGGPLVHAERTPRGPIGGLPATVDVPPAVTLSLVQQAQAIVEGMPVEGGAHACPTYTELQVNPPGTVFVFPVPATIDACRLQVHPVTVG